jgi:hypothetical protein
LFVVAAAIASSLVSIAPAAAVTSFSFAASGDLGGNANTTNSLNALATSGADFFLALGDMSYDEVMPESAWCDYVKAKLPAGYPFELVAGNHENSGVNGNIDIFRQCLPNQISGLNGDYAKEYYVDYPPSQPLVRVVMISPALSFAGTSSYSYNNGTTHQAWLGAAIDNARAAGIPWVVVGMHKNCITAGVKTCEIGPQLFNFLVDKKVDLILQAHDHGYQRSKQLALAAGCSSVTPNTYNASCVADDGSDSQYAKGNGPVLVIDGTFGRVPDIPSTTDAEAGYFAKFMGVGNTTRYGFMKYAVTDTSLSAQFVPTSAGTFTESWTITSPGGGGGGPDTTPPTASDVTVSTPAGTPVSVTLQGGDAAACNLTFTTTTPASGSLSALADQPCAPGSPNNDTATITYTPTSGFTGTDSFQYQVNDGTNVSSLATATITVQAPPVDSTAPIASDVTASTTSGAPVAVTLRGSDVEACNLTFATTNPLTNGGLGSINDQSCVAGSPNADTATVTYTPAAGFTGTNTFQYQVSDGTNVSNLASATITVSPAGGGGSATLPFTPIADATIIGDTAANKAANFGTTTTLEADSSPFKRFLLKFQVVQLNGRTVTSAVLRLTVTNPSGKGGDLRPASNTWVESGPGGVTWDTQPTSDQAAAALAALGPVTTGNTYNVTLPTSAIPVDGTYSFIASSTSSDGVAYWSREKGGSLAPQLILTVTGDGGSGGGPVDSTAPVATNVTASTTAGTPTAVNLRGTDVEACNLTFTTTNTPANGTLGSINDQSCVAGSPNADTATITYTPTAGFSGTNSFQYRVNDGTNSSALATATITVSPAPGGGGGGTGPATLVFPSIADATISGDTASNRATNFGATPTLEADSSPLRRYLVKFQVAGLNGRTVTGVQIRLVCENGSGKGGDFRPTTTPDWVESGFGGVTWDTQPPSNQSAPPLASLGSVKVGTTYTVTLPTSYVVSDGTYSLIISSTSSDAAYFSSRERGGTAIPQLIVTVT